MRRIGAWALSVTLFAGLLDSWAGAAEPRWRTTAKQESGSGGLFSRWFGSKDNSAQKKPEPGKDSNTTAPKPSKARAEAEQARAQAAFLRRMAVCDKLKQIGLETGNEELQRRADDLLERAQAAYSQRMALLPEANDGFESDEQSLDSRLGPNNASSKKTNRDSARDGRSAARKEKP